MKGIFLKVLAVSLSVFSIQSVNATDTYHFKQYAKLHQSNYVRSNYARTKYPIVMAHGMLGFGKLGTPDSGIDYWYQIIPDLARNGAQVWSTVVSPFESTEVRGEQLLEQVEEILAITGAEKINLISHSHGVQGARYIATVIPNNVASVTGIAGSNKGSPISDLILSIEGTPLEKPVVQLMTFISKFVVAAQSFDPNSFTHDPKAGAVSLSVAEASRLNKIYPGGMPDTACGDGPAVENGVRYYSFAGTGQDTSIFDLTDDAFNFTTRLIDNKRDNDGFVPRCSSKLGVTIRDNYYWNHLDEINQVLGLTSIFAPSPASVYRQQANRLKLQGL